MLIYKQKTGGEIMFNRYILSKRTAILRIQNASIFSKKAYGYDPLNPDIFRLFSDPLVERAAAREINNPWGIFSKVQKNDPARNAIYGKVAEMLRDEKFLPPFVVKLRNEAKRYILQCENAGIEPRFSTSYGPEEAVFPQCIIDAIKEGPTNLPSLR